MKFFDSLLGKKKEEEKSTTDSAMDDLLRQIMQPSIICDHCFFDGRQSDVTNNNNVVFCNTCQHELEQIMHMDKGTQLAFYLPKQWKEEERRNWVQAWKVKNFAAG